MCFFNCHIYLTCDETSRSSQKNNQSCSSSFKRYALLLYTMLSSKFFMKSFIDTFFYQTETFFTGLSDFHKLVLSIFKTTFTKSKAKEIIYRDFKKFNEQCFNKDLRTELSSKSVKSSFESIFLNTLNKYAPIKKKNASDKSCTIYY